MVYDSPSVIVPIDSARCFNPPFPRFYPGEPTIPPLEGEAVYESSALVGPSTEKTLTEILLLNFFDDKFHVFANGDAHEGRNGLG